MNESSLELIKRSFEEWYNSIQPDKMSIVTNYKDEQTLVVKAYHKATISMVAVGIKNGSAQVIPLFEISENYNHGITSEEETRTNLTQTLLVKILNFCSGKGKIN